MLNKHFSLANCAWTTFQRVFFLHLFQVKLTISENLFWKILSYGSIVKAMKYRQNVGLIEWEGSTYHGIKVSNIFESLGDKDSSLFYVLLNFLSSTSSRQPPPQASLTPLLLPLWCRCWNQGLRWDLRPAYHCRSVPRYRFCPSGWSGPNWPHRQRHLQKKPASSRRVDLMPASMTVPRKSLMVTISPTSKESSKTMNIPATTSWIKGKQNILI